MRERFNLKNAPSGRPITLPLKLPTVTNVSVPGTILVVEDNEAVRKFTIMTLRSHGYRILEAFDGESGLATFLRHRHKVELVLTDTEMTPHSGPEMVEEILRVDPFARIGFMSGTARACELPRRLNELPMLEKPFSAEHLIRFVRESVHATRKAVQ